MEKIIPNKLEKGDMIGIIAPSNPIEKDDLEKINNSILLMEASGFKVKFAKNALKNTLGYGVAAREKAEDINEMFADKEVKAIFCVSGGYNSNCTFEYIDYETIKNNPKIICGFSDNTSILDMINKKTGLVTFHGPTFKALTSWETELGYQQVIKKFVEKDVQMSYEDDEYQTIKEGTCEGELIGGNLSILSNMVSGEYKLDFKDKILFIEELGFESTVGMVSHNLYYLKQNKVFDDIKGIWLGNYYDPENPQITLDKILIDTLENEYNFPIIKSDNFGHIEKKLVIPIGAKAKINTNKKIKIELLEEIVK